jgi:hypothetical protein
MFLRCYTTTLSTWPRKMGQRVLLSGSTSRTRSSLRNELMITTIEQLGDWAVHVPKFWRNRWVSRCLHTQSNSIFTQAQEAGKENGNGGSFGRNVWSWSECAFPDAHNFFDSISQDATHLTPLYVTWFKSHCCSHSFVAGGCSCISCAQSWPFVVDCCFANSYPCQLLLDHMGGISYWCAWRHNKYYSPMESCSRGVVPRTLFRTSRGYFNDHRHLYYIGNLW